jgi:hypothetical protein
VHVVFVGILRVGRMGRRFCGGLLWRLCLVRVVVSVDFLRGSGSGMWDRHLGRGCSWWCLVVVCTRASPWSCFASEVGDLRV